MASNTRTMGNLPSGVGICSTIPDIFYLPELVFGGLVWILIASNYVQPANPLGWVMFVSVFCFLVTFIWMLVFACGSHQNSGGWAAADFAYHSLAAFFYLSASVALAYITLRDTSLPGLQYYRVNISAVVFSFITTLLYFVHAIFSSVRWKSF
ncbi:myelin and lymphocyte protein-like [Aplochiton taeniatus]